MFSQFLQKQISIWKYKSESDMFSPKNRFQHLCYNDNLPLTWEDVRIRKKKKQNYIQQVFDKNIWAPDKFYDKIELQGRYYVVTETIFAIYQNLVFARQQKI